MQLCTNFVLVSNTFLAYLKHSISINIFCESCLYHTLSRPLTHLSICPPLQCQKPWPYLDAIIYVLFLCGQKTLSLLEHECRKFIASCLLGGVLLVTTVNHHFDMENSSVDSPWKTQQCQYSLLRSDQKFFLSRQDKKFLEKDMIY